MKQEFEFLKVDSGDNIHVNIGGEKYTFATTEFYGGHGIYGVCFPNESHFTFIGRSRKAEKLYQQYKQELFLILNQLKKTA